jgi:hypothetical protein
MLGNIFNVFSKRKSSNSNMPISLSSTFRNRILMLLRDSMGYDFNDFLFHLQKKLAYLHGTLVLGKKQVGSLDPIHDVLDFLSNCENTHFLDAIEYVFQLENGRYVGGKEKPLVEQINEFFKIDDLPYYLTESVWEEVETSFYGTPTTGIRLREHPKIIRKDSDVLHKEVIEPALVLLRNKDLLNANEEFMLGLEDYKKGNYRDSVTKCNSSLESVMKVICARNKFSYKENDTAGTLIRNILSNTNMDSFWEQPIVLIATIRNKLSSSHGAGTKTKEVPEHVAKYVINSTASAILFLYDAAY